MRPSNHTIKIMIIEELKEAKRRGLWSNIRARRAAGKKRRKSNEKGYPKTLDISETDGDMVESLFNSFIDDQVHNLDESLFDRFAISAMIGASNIDVVDTSPCVAGKNTAAGDSWRELGKVASKFDLAESIKQIIREEIFYLNLKIKR